LRGCRLTYDGILRRLDEPLPSLFCDDTHEDAPPWLLRRAVTFFLPFRVPADVDYCDIRLEERHLHFGCRPDALFKRPRVKPDVMLLKVFPPLEPSALDVDEIDIFGHKRG